MLILALIFSAQGVAHAKAAVIPSVSTVPTLQATFAPEETAISASTRSETISAGEYHNCGIKSDGTVTCWGDNGSGAGKAREEHSFRFRRVPISPVA